MLIKIIYISSNMTVERVQQSIIKAHLIYFLQFVNKLGLVTLSTRRQWHIFILHRWKT